MSRPAAAPAPPVHERHRERLRPRPHGVPAARRVSGPARPRPRASAPPRCRRDTRPRPAAPAARPALTARAPQRAPQRPPLRLAAGGAAIALRVGETAMQVSGSRFMDRVVRSRAWVVIVGFGLIGIVAMQVSMLKLNSGIGRAVDTVATLERSNATLKADISRLSSGDRIQAAAGVRGYRMPEPADVTYLRPATCAPTASRPRARCARPTPSIAGPAGAMTAASVSDALTGEAGAGAATTTTPTTGRDRARHRAARRRRDDRDDRPDRRRRPPPPATTAPRDHRDDAARHERAPPRPSTPARRRRPPRRSPPRPPAAAG